jgi:hypothetical protein
MGIPSSMLGDCLQALAMQTFGSKSRETPDLFHPDNDSPAGRKGYQHCVGKRWSELEWRFVDSGSSLILVRYRFLTIHKGRTEGEKKPGQAGFLFRPL